MNIEQAQAAYDSDPFFRRAVDTFHAWIRESNVTPSEVRAAAMLACIHFESTHVRVSFIQR